MGQKSKNINTRAIGILTTLMGMAVIGSVAQAGVIDRICGKWMWKGNIATAIDGIFPYGTRCMPITIEPTDTDGEVVISCSENEDDYLETYNGISGIRTFCCKAAVNESDGSITIRGSQMSQQGQNPEYLFIAQYGEEQYWNSPLTELSDIKGTIRENGTIEFPKECLIGFGSEFVQNVEDMNMQSTYSMANKFVPVAEYVPDMKEFEYCGEARFSDCWFNPRLRVSGIDEIRDVQVPLFRKDYGTTILLLNPYSDKRWKECGFQKGDSNGYIILDVADPDYVKIQPVVKCGMKSSVAESGEPVDFFPYTASQWEQYVYNERDAECSTLEDNVIYIRHPVFGTEGAPFYCHNWKDSERENIGTILMPQGWSGVTGTLMAIGTEPEYYDLRGIRLNGPVKGRLIIELRDGKARKVIL